MSSTNDFVSSNDESIKIRKDFIFRKSRNHIRFRDDADLSDDEDECRQTLDLSDSTSETAEKIDFHNPLLDGDERMYAWQVSTDTKAPPFRKEISEWGKTSRLGITVRWSEQCGRIFPMKTLRPKVHGIEIPGIGKIPRQVEIERTKQRFSLYNLVDLMKTSEIEFWELIPFDKLKSIGEDSILFPLEWFDNDDFEMMNPDEWIGLGFVNGERFPIPADAFLPRLQIRDPKNWNALYEWRKVAVYDYDWDKQEFIVYDLHKNEMISLTRIRISFQAEDPVKFVQRLKSAIDFRANCTNSIKFNLMLDCIPLPNWSCFTTAMRKKVDRFLSSTRSRHEKRENFNHFLAEVILENKRAIFGLSLQNGHHENVVVPKNIDDFFPIIKKYQPESYGVDIKLGISRLIRPFLYVVKEPLKVMLKVIDECFKVESKPFYNVILERDLTFRQFLRTQSKEADAVIGYLKNEWGQSIVNLITKILSGVGKGWYDLTISDWHFYKVAKLSKLLRLIRYRMERTLEYLVRSSVRSFTAMICDRCEVDHGYEPIFNITLTIEEDGPTYTTNLYDFEAELIKLFDDPIRRSHEIPLIDETVMKRLVFPPKECLSSVGLIEPDIEENRQNIISSYRKVLVPVQEYAKSFEHHSELYRIDVDQYIINLESENRSASDIKFLIIYQAKSIEELQTTIPGSMDIGPFRIVVEEVKQHLILKRQQMKDRILEMFHSRVINDVEGYNKTYTDTMDQLEQRPESIEHILELREWMEKLPAEVESLKEQMREKGEEFDVLDYFWDSLDDREVSLVIQTKMWPERILKTIPRTIDTHDEIVEGFKKFHFDDLTNYDDQFQTINLRILEFHVQYDTTKAEEWAKNAGNIVKDLEELLVTGKRLNVRQEIFELKLLEVNEVEESIVGFEPYRFLWTTAAGYRQQVNEWTTTPFFRLETNRMRQTLDEFIVEMDRAYELLTGLENIQNVVRALTIEMNLFVATIDIMVLFKTPGWKEDHWRRLSKRSGISFIYSRALNFSRLETGGIMNHIDLIHEIRREANVEWIEYEEAELEKSRERKIEEKKAALRLERRKNRPDLF